MPYGEGFCTKVGKSKCEIVRNRGKKIQKIVLESYQKNVFHKICSKNETYRNPIVLLRW
ncbi:Protein CBG26073 [Caenorhabditis briggsae]|uniref:Protein CBG26073 n=1 Tax=Caenorhabditis briggsae TaxID=6238 RepID=B6ILQ6_CAEBR|nr:Protein CBG26073 [Caenorhabditis briggsae]CAS00836.1 Protein CBG26073 [Caenorhabditis briggsae]